MISPASGLQRGHEYDSGRGQLARFLRHEGFWKLVTGMSSYNRYVEKLKANLCRTSGIKHEREEGILFEDVRVVSSIRVTPRAMSS